MKVLVTGAKGMLGQDLCPYLEDIGCFVIPTDYDTLDITKEEEVQETISRIHPDLIIHCAAYTNVDKAEVDQERAHLLNVTGAKNVAMAANKISATMIYISTDYVFDGTKTTPYLPQDKPNPINVYGLTKYQGEVEVAKYCAKHYIARTSWLYGIHGKNFVETMLAAARVSGDPTRVDAQPLKGDVGISDSVTECAARVSGDPTRVDAQPLMSDAKVKPPKELKVVNDQIGCPTWTMELIQGLMKLLQKPYGIYHVCGSDHTSWYGFAKEIFKQENLKVNLIPCTTEEFPRPAKRPCYSVMENNNITRPWKEALSDYLKIRKGD